MSNTPALYDTHYKAKSYALFIGVLGTSFVLLVGLIMVLDHVVKSEEPLSGLFRKDAKGLAEENRMLSAKVDSLSYIAKQVPALKARNANQAPVVGETHNRALPPKVEVYKNESLKASNYNSYLAKAAAYYYAEAQRLEKWIVDNN